MSLVGNDETTCQRHGFAAALGCLFFETTAYWRLEPADALVSEGYCLAEPGRQFCRLSEPRRSRSL